MNNDSMIRESVQAVGQTTSVFKGEGAVAPVTPVFRAQRTPDAPMLSPRVPRSSLTPCQLIRARTREEMRKLGQNVWCQNGLALIDPLLITDDVARQALISEINRLYGRRATGAVCEVQP